MAQSGSAPASGAGGREFKSHYPDQEHDLSAVSVNGATDRLCAETASG